MKLFQGLKLIGDGFGQVYGPYAAVSFRLLQYDNRMGAGKEIRKDLLDVHFCQLFQKAIINAIYDAVNDQGMAFRIISAPLCATDLSAAQTAGKGELYGTVDHIVIIDLGAVSEIQDFAQLFGREGCPLLFLVLRGRRVQEGVFPDILPFDGPVEGAAQ